MLESLLSKIKQIETANAVNAFLNTYTDILGKTVSTVTEADKAAVEAALAAFEKLSSEEKAQLTSEKTLLNQLLSKIKTLESGTDSNPTETLRKAIEADYDNVRIEYDYLGESLEAGYNQFQTYYIVYDIAGNKLFSHSAQNTYKLLINGTVNTDHTQPQEDIYFEIKDNYGYTYSKNENTDNWEVERDEGDYPSNSFSHYFSVFFDYAAEDFDYADGVYTMKAAALDKYLEKHATFNSSNAFLFELLKTFISNIGIGQQFGGVYGLKIIVTDGFITDYELSSDFYAEYQGIILSCTQTFRVTFSNFGNVTVNIPNIG